MKVPSDVLSFAVDDLGLSSEEVFDVTERVAHLYIQGQSQVDFLLGGLLAYVRCGENPRPPISIKQYFELSDIPSATYREDVVHSYRSIRRGRVFRNACLIRPEDLLESYAPYITRRLEQRRLESKLIQELLGETLKVIADLRSRHRVFSAGKNPISVLATCLWIACDHLNIDAHPRDVAVWFGSTEMTIRTLSRPWLELLGESKRELWSDGLYNILREKGSRSAQELASELSAEGITSSMVASLMASLIDEGKVIVAGYDTSSIYALPDEQVLAKIVSCLDGFPQGKSMDDIALETGLRHGSVRTYLQCLSARERVISSYSRFSWVAPWRLDDGN